MKYNNREMKVGTIISHVNDNTINLIPPFQRGTVWNLKTRQMLALNMVRQRPIPAIFLYKEAAGSRFSYNILDGKQRIETLMLFVGDQHPELKIEHIRDHFFKKPADNDRNFKIKLDGKMRGFGELDEATVRDFREYAISTIEIDLDDEDSGVDEIVDLFIDINQYGVKVNRFDVVKAMGKDPLFKQMFDLVALRQERKQSLFYKAKSSPYVSVLKRLAVVERLADPNSRVDRMWERLTEIALFSRSNKHRKPVEILKGFIGATDRHARLKQAELAALRRPFVFLDELYKKQDFGGSKLATDQPQFYTIVTTLLASDLLDRTTKPELVRKFLAFRKATEVHPTTGAIADVMKEYRDVSAKQTTDSSRRDKRQELLVKAIDLL